MANPVIFNKISMIRRLHNITEGEINWLVIFRHYLKIYKNKIKNAAKIFVKNHSVINMKHHHKS